MRGGEGERREGCLIENRKFKGKREVEDDTNIEIV